VSDPGLGGGVEARVAFLRQPRAYAESPGRVETIETHMSWVFLTHREAYKLKKPIRYDSLDFTAPEQRRRNCHAEVRLNRRLAPGVYLGVVVLTREPDGALALDGSGAPEDWLVRMRRLPAGRMLETVIAAGRAAREEASIRDAGRHLARFYRDARSIPISADAYRRRLADGTRSDLRELCRPRFGLSRRAVELLAQAQLEVLEIHRSLFDPRVQAGRIVEGHGDLRPEHVCLLPDPAIIDCLEFDRDLRLLDPADELAFLGLECERLGQPIVGRWFLETYTEVTGDAPPGPLLRFYRVYRALRRAKIAIWHLDDPSVRDPDRFAARARRYLELAASVAA